MRLHSQTHEDSLFLYGGAQRDNGRFYTKTWDLRKTVFIKGLKIDLITTWLKLGKIWIANWPIGRIKMRIYFWCDLFKVDDGLSDNSIVNVWLKLDNHIKAYTENKNPVRVTVATTESHEWNVRHVIVNQRSKNELCLLTWSLPLTLNTYTVQKPKRMINTIDNSTISPPPFL